MPRKTRSKNRLGSRRSLVIELIGFSRETKEKGLLPLFFFGMLTKLLTQSVLSGVNAPPSIEYNNSPMQGLALPPFYPSNPLSQALLDMYIFNNAAIDKETRQNRNHVVLYPGSPTAFFDLSDEQISNKKMKELASGS